MKKIIAITMALVMCLSVAACSQSAEPTEPVVTTVPAEPTEPPIEPTEPPTKPTEPLTQPAVSSENRKLTIVVPDTWIETYVYTLDPEDFGAYPGTQLTERDLSVAPGEYSILVKDTMMYLVVTGTTSNGSRLKTADILLTKNASQVVVVISEDGSYRISYPDVSQTARFTISNKPCAAKTTGTPSVYRVVGGGATDATDEALYNGAWLGNWQPDWEGGLMYEVEPGLYRKNFENVQPGRYLLKITKDGKWDGAYGAGEDGTRDCEFYIDVACDITVDFKIVDGIGYIELYGLVLIPAL